MHSIIAASWLHRNTAGAGAARKARNLKTAVAMAVLGLGCLATAPAAITYYVAASGGGGISPYTNWSMASSNLMALVERARDNDVIYVTNNATYYLTNYIKVSYAITIRSWAPDGGLDPATTIINGNYPDTTNKHFYLNNDNATIAGFTLTNGCNADSNVVNGGSIYLYKGLVTNCIITGNRCHTGYRSDGDRAYIGGGGIFAALSGGVWNCTISGNTTSNGGGGIMVMGAGPWKIMNCTIAGNYCGADSRGVGGGIRSFNTTGGLIISNCWIVSNSAYVCGGIYNTTWGGQYGEIYDCRIIGNTAYVGNGGGLFFDYGGIARNCLIANNVSSNYGGGVYLSRGKVVLLQNCCIVSNFANRGGGVASFEGSNHVENTIIWGNFYKTSYSNWYVAAGTFPTFTNCATAPDSATYMTGTVVDDPLFKDFAGGDYHLTQTSPCINKAFYREWMAGATDLDGRPRLDRIFRLPDIGACEYIYRGSLFSVR